MLRCVGTVQINLDRICKSSISELTEVAGLEMSLAPRKPTALVTQVSSVQWVSFRLWTADASNDMFWGCNTSQVHALVLFQRRTSGCLAGAQRKCQFHEVSSRDTSSSFQGHQNWAMTRDMPYRGDLVCAGAIWGTLCD